MYMKDLQHRCSDECFDDFRQEIHQALYKKLENYTATDQQTRFEGCHHTIDEYDALILLKSTGCICRRCDERLELHGWKAGSPTQFSFDRLDDNDTHYLDNIEVVCLRCNKQKADQAYKPNYEHMAEYKKWLQVFMDLKYNESWPKEQKRRVRGYLAHLHEEVFMGSKPNNWIVNGFITKDPPDAFINPANAKYYMRGFSDEL
jgi:hypothetical protein